MPKMSGYDSAMIFISKAEKGTIIYFARSSKVICIVKLCKYIITNVTDNRNYNFVNRQLSLRSCIEFIVSTGSNYCLNHTKKLLLYLFYFASYKSHRTLLVPLRRMNQLNATSLA